MADGLGTTILASTVVAAIATALFNKFSKDKTDELTHITSSRKSWEDEMREGVIALRRFHDSEGNNKENNSDDSGRLQFQSYAEAKAFFKVRLNPDDKFDKNILGHFDKEENKVINIEGIEDEVARLLKHEWEKRKFETKKSNQYYLYYFLMVTIGTVVTCFCTDSFKSIFLKDRKDNLETIYLFKSIFLKDETPSIKDNLKDNLDLAVNLGLIVFILILFTLSYNIIYKYSFEECCLYKIRKKSSYFLCKKNFLFHLIFLL